MPSLSSRLVAVVLRVGRANRAFVNPEAAHRLMDERRLHPQGHTPPRRLRRDVSVSVATVHGWPVYTITPRTSEPRGSVVYLHGGAWVNEIARQHWHLAAQIAAAGTTVIVPIYPLVPGGTATAVNAGVVDLALAARAAHGDVKLAGDSAGGQIAMSAALSLRDDHAVALPLVVLISPAVDPSMKNPQMDVVQPSDPWLAKEGTRVFLDSWRDGVATDDPRVNPLEADLHGLGPVLIFSGTRDILNPDARLLVEKARAEGVAVEYVEREGLVHVYPLTPTPEGRDARALIVERLTSATVSAGG